MLLNICSRYERMRCSRIKQHNCRSVVDEKRSNNHIWNLLGFLHCDVIDLPMNIVLSRSNKNIISYLRRELVGIGALVGKVTFLPTSIALLFTL
jgi:hypothetical protein